MDLFKKSPTYRKKLMKRFLIIILLTALSSGCFGISQNKRISSLNDSQLINEYNITKKELSDKESELHYLSKRYGKPSLSKKNNHGFSILNAILFRSVTTDTFSIAKDKSVEKDIKKLKEVRGRLYLEIYERGLDIY